MILRLQDLLQNLRDLLASGPVRKRQIEGKLVHTCQYEQLAEVSLVMMGDRVGNGRPKVVSPPPTMRTQTRSSISSQAGTTGQDGAIPISTGWSTLPTLSAIPPDAW